MKNQNTTLSRGLGAGFSLLTVLALVCPNTAVAAAPDDIQRIKEVATLIEGESGQTVPQEEYFRAFTGLVVMNTTAIINENGLPDASNRVVDARLRRRISTKVEEQVGAALNQNGTARREALYAALTYFSQRAVADDIVSSWLGVKTMGEYAHEAAEALEKEERSLAETAKAAADTARGERPLTTAERIAAQTQTLLEAARKSDEVRAARRVERFRRRVQVAPSSGELRINSSAVTLVSDAGGSGAQNGVADAGEWVTFTLPVANTGLASWFSSSAWVRSQNECAWSNGAREFELPELAPGGSASVEVHAYFSEACADGTQVQFAVEIRDSARAATTPIVFDIGVVATNVGKPALRGLRIDSDVPGSSDGSASPSLAMGRKMELSAGIKLPKPGAIGALQAWGLSNDLAPVVAESGYRLGGVMSVAPTDSGGAFAPFDDLDVSAKSGGSYSEGASSVASRHRWSTPADAGGVAVVEARVTYSGAEGAWAPAATASIPATPPQAPSPRPTPSAAATLAMLREAISLEAREIETKDDALVSVTSTIFDAHVDEAAFALDWCRATTPLAAAGSPDPCDPNAKSAPSTEPPPIKVNLPAFTDPAGYTFRSYVWVPMEWVPGGAEVAAPAPRLVARATPEEPKKVAAPEPGPERRKRGAREPSLLGFSGGAEIGRVALRDDAAADVSTLLLSTTEPQLWVDASIGKKGIRAHLDGAASLGLSSALASGQSMSAYRFGAGAGYAFGLARRWVEIEPDVYVGARLVSIKGDFGNRNGANGAATILSPYVEPAVSARWFPLQQLSIDGTLAYRVQLAHSHTGPVTVDVADASGVKVKLGIGLHF